MTAITDLDHPATLPDTVPLDEATAIAIAVAAFARALRELSDRGLSDPLAISDIGDQIARLNARFRELAAAHAIPTVSPGRAREIRAAAAALEGGRLRRAAVKEILVAVGTLASA